MPAATQSEQASLPSRAVIAATRVLLAGPVAGSQAAIVTANVGTGLARWLSPHPIAEADVEAEPATAPECHEDVRQDPLTGDTVTDDAPGGQHCEHDNAPTADGGPPDDLITEDGASARSSGAPARTTLATTRAVSAPDDASRLGEALRSTSAGASPNEGAEAMSSAGLRASVPASQLGNDLYAQAVLGQYVLSAHRQLVSDQDERRRRRARNLAGAARKPDVGPVESIDAEGSDPDHHPSGDSEPRQRDHHAGRDGAGGADGVEAPG